jgi:hypothetical protein
MRVRVAAAACVALLVAMIPLAQSLNSRRQNLATSDSSALTWQEESLEAARIAAATSPDDVGDYLMPGATRVGDFAATYADATWQDDSDWTSSN